MASTSSPSSAFAIRCRGNKGFCGGESRPGRGVVTLNPWPLRSRSRPSVCSTAIAAAGSASEAIPDAKRMASLPGGAAAARADPLLAEKLDEWVQKSVIEIVRNIGEAPFLVHVFSNGDGNGASSSSSCLSSSPSPPLLRLQREVADAASWPRIVNRWRAAAAPPPDGVILVEELAEDEKLAAASSSSKTWGLLVQGRGADSAVCYILRTSRVHSTAGFCTHFCLAKAKCFGDSAAAQLRSSWLLAQ